MKEVRRLLDSPITILPTPPGMAAGAWQRKLDQIAGVVLDVLDAARDAPAQMTREEWRILGRLRGESFDLRGPADVRIVHLIAFSRHRLLKGLALGPKTLERLEAALATLGFALHRP